MKTIMAEVGVEETAWLINMIDELTHGKDMTDLMHELKINGVDISMATFYRNFKPQNGVISPKNIPTAIRIINILSRVGKISVSSDDVFPIMAALQEEGFVGVSLLELTLLCAFAEHSKHKQMTPGSLAIALQYFRDFFPTKENGDEEYLRESPRSTALALPR